MLKVGLPRDAIKAKMQHEGVNPSYLDKDAAEMVPLEGGDGGEVAGGDAGGGGTKVAVSEHPLYAKYFKMIKVGLPKEAIKAKMQQEGANPSFLDKDPEEQVYLTEPGKGGAGGATDSSKAGLPKPPGVHGAGAGGAHGANKAPKVRKKKLYWKALDASQVGKNSLWADKDDDILLDVDEFNQLFVER